MAHVKPREMDIWGAGCVLYLLLTGTRFDIAMLAGCELRPAMVQLVTARVVYPRWLEAAALEETRRKHSRTPAPALAVDLLQKLMRVDPGARPTAADALVHPWFAASAEA